MKGTPRKGATMFPKKPALILLVLLAPVCHAATYYVSPSGSDERTAQQAQKEETPWRSVAKALDVAGPGDRAELLPGIYRQGNIVLKKSGTKDAPITLAARKGAILSGGLKMARWTQVQGKIYRSEPIDLAPFKESKKYPTILFEDGHILNHDHGGKLETMKPGSGLWEKSSRTMLAWCREGDDPSGHAIELPCLGHGIVIAEGVRHLILEGLDMRYYNVMALKGNPGCGDILVRDCSFRNNTRYEARFSGDHVRVERCRFEWCGSIGLGFGGKTAFECIASDCTATHCGNCYYASGGCRDIVFERCEASHFCRRAIPHSSFKADGDAIGMGVSTGTVVRNCVFRDGGWEMYKHNPVVQWGKRTTRPNWSTAFDVWRAEKYCLESNLILRCDSGVHVAPGTDGVIRGNTIVGMKRSGISTHGVKERPVRGVLIDRNTIVGCKSGVWLSDVTTDVRLTSNILADNELQLSVLNPKGFFADCNCFFSSKTPRVISWLKQIGDLAQYRKWSGMGANSIQAAPMFVDVKKGDFRLRPGSPAIATGQDRVNMGACGVAE